MSNQIAQSNETPLWKDGRNVNIQFLSSWKRLEKESPEVYSQIIQREGFTCQDHEYEYKVGMSKFGLWLSRFRTGVNELKAVATTEAPVKKIGIVTGGNESIAVHTPRKTTEQAIEELVYAINSLVIATLASSEAVRDIVKARLSVKE